MEVLVAYGRELSASKEFERSLNDTYLVKQRAERVSEALCSRLDEAELTVRDAEQDLRDAEAQDPLDPESVENLKQEVREREKELGLARDESEIWQRESTRRTAVAYCIAFETFLRDFLIDWVEANPHQLEAYFLTKIHKAVDYSKKLDLALAISKTPLGKDDVDECVAAEFSTFQDLKGKVTSAYRSFLGKEPFSGFVNSQNVFPNSDAHSAALTDIYLLFEIRHKLIHRNGRPDEKYREALKRFGCYDRLSPQLKISAQAPWPDHILMSSALESHGDKLDEIAGSLLTYARYIEAVCS